MNANEKQVMHQAVAEIRHLRHANEILDAKVSMVNLMSQFLFATPRQEMGQGYGEDVAWRIEQILASQDQASGRSKS